MMKLQEIYIYPIKSLGGIRLTEAQVEIKGLHLDRRWMLVDKNGLFMSQRTLPQMALLQVEIESDGLKVSHKQDRTLNHRIPFEPETNELIPVTIWDDMVIGQVVNSSSNTWFSQVLGIPSQLVFMPEGTHRHVQEKYQVNKETVSFADAMPFLLIGQKSLDDLNQKLSVPLPMNRFRPNFVVAGGEAFQEDRWDRVRIGECIFKVTKPCARCVLTTVDQATAIKGKEPLKTLASYRTKDNKVLFGQNMIALTTGKIKVGDDIQEI
jgi:uncharacterized protein YcbX